MRIVRLVIFGLLAAILLAATSSPVDVVHKVALTGGVNSAPVSVIGKAAMVGPASSTSISVISRSVLGGPIEDLVSAVIAAARGTSRNVLEVCPSGCAYSTIQDAIDAASDGDEILVRPGTYTGSDGVQNPMAKLLNKSVWLHSSDGPEATVFSGSNARVVFDCRGSQSSDTVIEGFTFANGYGVTATTGYAGGLHLYDYASISVINCIFKDNYADYGGGVRARQYSQPSFESCQFLNNEAGYGAGVRATSGGTFTNCIFLNNSGGAGGGMWTAGQIWITGCLFQNNSAESSGGGIYNHAQLYVSGTTMCDNMPGGNISEYSWTDLGGNTIQETCPLLGTCCVSECGISVACYDDESEQDCLDLGGEWTGGALCSDINCGPVQWTVEEGGNGHWYGTVYSSEALCWSESKDSAEQLNGHLTTIGSAEEQAFIADVTDASIWSWLGGYKDGTDWHWVTGEPWDYTNWQTNEPNGDGSALAKDYGSQHPRWNDQQDCNTLYSYIIEFSADCNNDGIVDYGQILDGTLADLDCNGIPDICMPLDGYGACCIQGVCIDSYEEQPCLDSYGFFYEGQICADIECQIVFSVDDDGLDDPDADFNDIQDAINHSGPGFVINVQPGTYTGTGDSVINLPSHGISIIGIGEVIIDGEGVRRGISGSSDLLVQGITFTNGFAGSGGIEQFGEGSCGGAIEFTGASLTILDCLFDANYAAWGGAIYVFDNGFLHCERSGFTGNSVVQLGGAFKCNGTGFFSECWFIDGYAVNDGGVTDIGWGPHEPVDITMERCYFAGNTADNGGDGIDLAYDNTTLVLEQCYFRDNPPQTIRNQNANGGYPVFEISNTYICNGGVVIDSGEMIDGGGNDLDNADCAPLIDCDSDGIDDAGQLWMGWTTDIECDGLWVVDDDGLDDPDADFDNIQEAVDAAVDGDEILVMPGTYTGSGDDVVFIGNKDLLLHSNSGPETTIIDGEGARRVLMVTGSTNGSYIEGFTITGGVNTYSNEPEGGGITVQGSSTISNCVISGNSAGGDYGKGGGIRCNGSPTIIGCTVSGNSAYEGGGIYVNSSTALITGCIISGNNANYGAGVHARNFPGANFDNCLITNNNATGSGGYGGGVYVSNSDPRFTSCTISSNYAGGSFPSGGGAYFGQFTYSTLTDCVVCDNLSGGGQGGPQYNQIQGPWTNNGGNTVSNSCPPLGACCIQGVCIDDYEAQDCSDVYGFIYEGQACADIVCETVFSVDDDGLDDPEADFNDIQDAINHSGPGFVINVQPGTYTGTDDNIITLPAHGISIIGVPGSTIIDGQGQRRGLLGDGCGDNGTVIQGLTIQNCSDGWGGGGIKLVDCSPAFIDCLIKNNSAIMTGGHEVGGGAYLLGPNCEPTFTGCDFVGNTAVHGGGVRVEGDSNEPHPQAVFVDCSFTANTTTWYGGGIQSNHADPAFTNCTFSSNTAGYSGGGMYLGTSNASLTLCLFDENTTTLDDEIEGPMKGGGGLGVIECGPTITSCIFTQNTSVSDGGGLYLVRSSSTTATVSITDCLFEANRAYGDVEYGLGGGILSFEMPLTITNTDFLDNVSKHAGGGLYLLASVNSTLTNCTFDGNIAGLDSNDNDIGGDGGAIRVDGQQDALFDTCRFINNHANDRGGGLFITITETSLVELRDCTIKANHAVGYGDSTYGGGFAGGGWEDFIGSPTLTGTLVCGNTPDQYDGSWNDNGGNIISENCPWIVDDLYDDFPNADFDNIQEAVDAASDGDEIIVMPGTYTSVGDQVVSVHGKNLWLHGLEGETENTIIDGEQSRRVLLLTGNLTTETIVDGFTITNANNPVANGGGIICETSSPTIRNCVISNGGQTGGDYGGIGIFCANSSSPLIQNCYIHDNWVNGGGGGINCWDNSSPTISGCTITGNVAHSGGGIVSNNCHPVIIDCVITNNQAANSDFSCGGGVLIVNGSMTISNSTICENTCGNTPDQIVGTFTNGGGNYIADLCLPDDGFGACCIQGVCIDDYEAQDCADAYGFFYNQQFCTDVICETVFSVDDDGLDDPDADFNNIQDAINHSGPGFVINVQPGTYTGTGENIITLPAHGISIIGVPGSTIIDGQGQRRGLLGDGCGDNGTVIDGLTFRNGLAGAGGGIMLVDCSPSFIDCLIENNQATVSGELQVGGGAYIFGDDCNPTFTTCDFLGNAAVGGGGVMISGTSPEAEPQATFLGCNFSDNTSSYYGGGVQSGAANPVFSNCTFTNNTTTYCGGGVFIHVGNPDFSACTFVGNVTTKANEDSEATQGGGGIGASSCSLTIDNCTFTENSTVQDGGGLHVGNGSTVTIQDSDIEDNFATWNGGGLHVVNSSLELTNCTVSGNSGDHSGGIYGEGGGFTMTGCTFSGNVSTWASGGEGGGSGGAGQIHSAILNIDSCVFENNTGWQHGGALKVDDCESTFSNCLFTGNETYNDAGGTLSISRGDATTLSNCIMEGNEGSAVRLDDCPALIDNCTIRNNDGGGLRVESAEEMYPSLMDTIICGNTDEQITGGSWIDLGGNYIEVTCAPLGACCVGDCDLQGGECFDDLYDFECEQLGGTIRPGMTCDQGPCQAVQWTVEEGGNGHWYQTALTLDNITWTVASSESQANGGHLATLTYREENDWVHELTRNSIPDWGFDYGPWIGGFQDLDSPDYSEPAGAWTWVTGEAWGFTAWNTIEPNDGNGGTEHWLQMTGNPYNTTWNDAPDDMPEGVFSYVIEWSADIASPTGCEPDGIVDYGQILDGTLADVDCNGIPDICMPPDGTGACCIQGVCIDDYEAQDCSDSYGFFYNQQACSDVVCETVFSVDDDGLDDPDADFNDIQDAINHSGPGFVINVQPGTYTGTGENIITLPAHGISIIGVPGSTIIDGEGARRGLIGFGCHGSGVIIEGLTFSNCYVDGTIDDEGTGAGMYLYEPCITIRNCEFLSNTANLHGGGIRAVEGSVDLETCYFFQNESLANRNIGGGIFFSDGIYNIAGCTFKENTADSGGGAGLWGCDANVINCTFTDNIGLGSGSKSGGGGLVLTANSSGPCFVTLDNCEVSGNNIHGIRIEPVDDDPVTLDLSNSKICGNEGSQVLGSYTDNGGNTIRTNCDYWVVDDLYDDDPNADFDNIQEAVDAASDGDEILVMPGTYTDTQDGHVVDMQGKAVWLHGLEEQIENTIIDGEAQRRGIAFFNGETPDTIIEHLTVTNAMQVDFDYNGSGGINYWENDGGGLMIVSCLPTIRNCFITGNSSSAGAGIYVYGTDPLISGCRVTDNIASDYGGGIHLTAGSADTVLENCTICGNSAGNYGEQVNGDFIDGGGNYIADECRPDPDNGACCVSDFPEATCISNISEAECTDQEGTFYLGATCEETTCSAVGACCFDGGCDITFEADCSGQWYLDTDCSTGFCDIGACCYSDLTCLETTSQECTGTFTPDVTCDEVQCQPDPGFGACCIGTTCSDNVAESDCIGDWYESTLCSDTQCVTGACCLPDLTCIDNVTGSKCDGAFYQDLTCSEVICTPPTGFGACCLGTGCVENVLEEDCAGDWYEGTLCSDVDCITGACCYQDLTCVDGITDSKCDGLFTPNATCAETLCHPYAGYGACCTVDGCQDNVAFEDCDGDFYEGDLCFEIDCITGACCLPDLNCIDGVTSDKCDGVFYQDLTCSEVTCLPFPGYGACCTSGWTCDENVLETDCDGTWYEQALCSQITCVEPDPIGSCCLGINCIDDRTESECTKIGGTWQGTDTICDAYTCAPTGACCTDGDCTIEYEIDCTGNYLGDDTTCEGDPCYIAPPGACCLPDGSCVDDVTEAKCTTFGGLEWNEGLDCTQVDCSLRGACCLPDGSCIEDLTEAKCDSTGGDWNQDLSCKQADCPQPAWACCLTNGDCVNATETKCSTFGGEWNDGLDCTQVDCSLRGACCLPDGSCIENLTLAKCDANGGDWNQDLSCKQADCPQPAWACCLTNGDCVNATETKCSTFGGEWNDGLDCTQVDCSLRGACCLPDGSCIENLTLAKCDANGGDWNQDLTCKQADCPQPDPTGACCLSSGGCVQSTEATCTDFEGKGWYSGEDCSEVDCSIATGACCVDGVTCYDTLSLSNCASIGGIWTMATSCSSIDCEPTTGACCFGGVYCVENIEQDDCSGTDSYWEGGAFCSDPELKNCTDDGEPVETGACCFDGETCYDEFPELACTGNGGTWFGVDTTCSINAPDCQPIIGACCTLEGLCIDGTSAADCSNYGGEWNGIGSACSEVDCTKACCFESEGWQFCENLAKEDCQLIEGTWHDDQVCDPNGDGQADDSPCAPFGACCLLEGSCVNTTEVACQGSGYWFEGEDCSLGNPCDDVVFVIEGSCIQESIDIAADGDIVVVEAGTYDGSECGIDAPNSIIDPKGKDIKIVSLSGAELTILDGTSDGTSVQMGIFCDGGEGSSTLIEGFTIRNYGQTASGHGLKCTSPFGKETSPTIRDCIFEGNRRNGIGSAALLEDSGTNPEFINCIFRNNGGTDQGDGGAVACTTSCSPLFSNCTFENNRDNRDGGGALLIGIANPQQGSHPRLINCTFESNECNLDNGRGGAVRITGFSNEPGWPMPQFTNCTFRENYAWRGGAIWDAEGDSFMAAITNCQFVRNSAVSMGGAMSLDDDSSIIFGELTNSYFCGNTAPAYPHIAQYSAADLQHLVDDHDCLFEDECDLPVGGACCYPGGGCIQQTSEECNGWAWHEDTDCSEVDCTPPDLTGACCLPDGSCIDEQTEDECFTQSGDWNQDLTCEQADCPQPPTGACCTDGDCTIVTEANCPGEYQGDDTTCEADTCQECTGDYDGSGNTSVEDLLFVIAGWGNPYDVNDLLTVIADWGCGTAP